MEKISILLTNRNTLEFLRLAVSSIRKNQSVEHELIIMDDNSIDGSKEWLEKNKDKYKYTYYTHNEPERKGIVNIVDEGIETSKHNVVFVGHSDMYYCKGFDKNAIKHLKKGIMVSSTRIEPPLHPQEPCKITRPFGNFVEDFDERSLKFFVDKTLKENKDKTTKGSFAPNMFYKEDWIGHDKLFYPQSREDCDMRWRWKLSGKDFIQSWDSLVYHFTSRGSRYNNETKNTLKDSSEWKRTNWKNLKNFVRRYKSPPLYTSLKEPHINKEAMKIKISATVLASENDYDLIHNFLDGCEPFFDEMVFVIDEDTLKGKDLSESKIKEEIDNYSNETIENGPTNFAKSKFKIVKRKLNKNFAEQTNYATSLTKHDWCFKADLDEQFEGKLLHNLRDAVLRLINGGMDVCGFPRINLIDGEQTNVYPDYQFRLYHRDIKWVGEVHEKPYPVAIGLKRRYMLTNDAHIVHNKTSKRQKLQNDFYKEIIKGKKPTEIKKIIYDSVIYTHEGITKHAREEAKELHNRGYHIQLLDMKRGCDFEPIFQEMYKPIDILGNDYCVICNQPPTRWPNKTLGLRNFIGYLAFEGRINDDWVKMINNNNVRELWTPSNYCKQLFRESGVTKPIKIIPHGVDPTIWRPTKAKGFGKFTFLWAGTPHNTRKGMDIAIRTFSKEFKGNDDAQLILKTNKIYNRDQDIESLIAKHIYPDGNDNIYIVDDNLKEEEFVDLMNKVDCFISPHRSEGFNIILLQALACGTPSIATGATGNMDYCKDSECLLVGVEDRPYHPPYQTPYERSEWFRPNEIEFEEAMRSVYENYGEIKDKTLRGSDKIRNDWSWGKTVDKIEKELEKITKGE